MESKSSQVRFAPGDIVFCVDNGGVGRGLTSGKTYEVTSADGCAFLQVLNNSGYPEDFLARRFRRATLHEMAMHAKANPRNGFDVGDLVTCVNTELSSARLTLGQVYRVVSVYSGSFESTGVSVPQERHQYLEIQTKDGEFRRSGQSFLRFRRATSWEIAKYKGTGSATTPSPTTPSPVYVCGREDIPRANAAMAIPSDGRLKDSDGREFDIVDWNPTSGIDAPVRVDAKLQPRVPQAADADESSPKEASDTATETPTPPEAVAAEPPLLVGEHVVLSAKGRENAKLRSLLKYELFGVVSSVNEDKSRLSISLDPEDGEERLWPAPTMEVSRDEVVAIGRDYYLVPEGAMVEEGDECWESNSTWMPVTAFGFVKASRHPLRRRKPRSLDGLTLGKYMFVKVLGPRQELKSAPYWNPAMSSMIGKVFCVSEAKDHHGEPVVRLMDDREDVWTLAYDWLTWPTGDETRAYQASLVKVGAVVFVWSIDGKGRLLLINSVQKTSGGKTTLRVETEDCKSFDTHPHMIFRAATKWEVEGFLAAQESQRSRQPDVAQTVAEKVVGQEVTIELDDFVFKGIATKAQASSWQSGVATAVEFTFSPISCEPKEKKKKEPEAPKAASPSPIEPLEPGEGYRFLDPKEPVVEGDEFWGHTGGKVSHGWLPSANYRLFSKGAMQGSFRYRRRNKFAEGELVQVIKPLNKDQRPMWIPEMNPTAGKVVSVGSIDRDGDYRLVGLACYYNGDWLAPASTEQKEALEKEQAAKKEQIKELESKMKDIQSQLNSLRK
jgi:hypothetical protein